MKKADLIRKLKKLPFGDIIYGYNANGDVININGYDEDTDTFTTYDSNLKCTNLRFEELPTVLLAW